MDDRWVLQGLQRKVRTPSDKVLAKGQAQQVKVALGQSRPKATESGTEKIPPARSRLGR